MMTVDELYKLLEKQDGLLTGFQGETDGEIDTLVFSVGCDGNALQRVPNFAVESAKNGERVLVCNFSQQSVPNPSGAAERQSASDTELEETLKRMHPNMILRFLTKRLPYPLLRSKEEIEKRPLEYQKQAEKDNINHEMYIEQLIKSKQKNPNLKFVLLFTVGSLAPQQAFSIVKRLEESGLFTRGKDLELVLAYSFDTPQAAVLRGDIPKDVINFIYNDNKDTKTNFYDKNKDLYFFGDLAEIKQIFGDLQPPIPTVETRHPAELRAYTGLRSTNDSTNALTNMHYGFYLATYNGRKYLAFDPHTYNIFNQPNRGSGFVGSNILQRILDGVHAISSADTPIIVSSMGGEIQYNLWELKDANTLPQELLLQLEKAARSAGVTNVTLFDDTAGTILNLKPESKPGPVTL